MKHIFEENQRFTQWWLWVILLSFPIMAFGPFDEKDVNYIDDKRNSTDWYPIANEFCKINDANIFNPNHKFYTWNDVWDKIKENKKD